MQTETYLNWLTDSNGIPHNGDNAIILQFLESVFEVLACDELQKMLLSIESSWALLSFFK